jgi:hypothetical protein
MPEASHWRGAGKERDAAGLFEMLQPHNLQGELRAAWIFLFFSAVTH